MLATNWVMSSAWSWTTVARAPASWRRRTGSAKLAVLRAHGDGAAEAGGFEGVLAAGAHEAAADEDDWGEAVEEAEFAHGVGDPDAAGRRVLPGGAAGCVEGGGEFGASLGVAGGDDGEEGGMPGQEGVVDGGGDVFLARVGAGGEP